MRMLPYPGPEAALRRALADARVDPARLLVTEMLPFATHLLLKRQVRPKRARPHAACGGERVACGLGRLLSFGQPRRRRRRRRGALTCSEAGLASESRARGTLGTGGHLFGLASVQRALDSRGAAVVPPPLVLSGRAASLTPY